MIKNTSFWTYRQSFFRKILYLGYPHCTDNSSYSFFFAYHSFSHFYRSHWLTIIYVQFYFAVVFNLFALCLYAGSFDSISYDMIPKWSALYDMELSWSFTIGCVGTCLSLIGSTTSIYMALKYGTNLHLTTNVSRVPSLHIHPPPSSRLSSPPRFASPRVSSPLPFSTKKYSSQGTCPKRNITPVHISWICE